MRAEGNGIVQAGLPAALRRHARLPALSLVQAEQAGLCRGLHHYCHLRAEAKTGVAHEKRHEACQGSCVFGPLGMNSPHKGKQLAAPHQRAQPRLQATAVARWHVRQVSVFCRRVVHCQLCPRTIAQPRTSGTSL